MITTINALIFIVIISPVWISITILNVFVKFIGGENGLIEGIKYSIKRFHELDSFYFLLEIIIIPFYCLFYAGKGLVDIYPFFWEFAKYNHPLLAFIISCIAYPFWTSFFKR